MADTAAPSDENRGQGKPGLPLIGKFGVFGLIGVFASFVGFTVDFTPSYAELTSQGLSPPGSYERQKAYTLHLINPGDGPAEDVRYRITAAGQVVASGSIDFLDTRRHSGEHLPLFQAAPPVKLCVLYVTEAEFPVLSVFGFAPSIPRKMTASLEAQMRPGSDLPGYRVVREENTGFFSGALARAFSAQTCD